MYTEQALREMFNTVLEIDTAMTGLYRVTDLTTSQYDVLFNNMISSAKEYGATLNDIINATTDWVRAGFEADTALGLAEVTTMYQHISDLDYDTAAENLITAYNGFKDELDTAFSGDQVAAVNYIADIFNELDNNFAVTSAGLGEALTRSASALDLAGNTIQETAG
jgi:TP901 family phage tail tape measure protein